MTRDTAVTIGWVSLLAAIIFLAVLAVFAKMNGVDVKDLGIREAISGLIGLLGVALASRVGRNRPPG